jgi:putative heme-binding domain-containing protein
MMRHVGRLIVVGALLAAGDFFWSSSAALAEDAPSASSPSPAAPLVKLMQSGKLPAERIGMVAGMVCDKGNADDLAFLYQQAIDAKAWPKETRLKVLDLLIDAAQNRKVIPSGDLSALKNLVLPSEATKDETLQLKAIHLAGLWKVKSLAGDLRTLALTSPNLSRQQTAAIESLGVVGGPESKAALEKLAAAGQPLPLRYMVIVALAKVDVNAAAKAAAAALADGTPQDDPGTMLDEFLNRKNGPELLAAAIGNVKLKRDVARLALRYMFSVGHSEAVLSDLLSKAADVPANPPLPTEPEVQAITAEVVAKGDPARGEEIFRRADISCMRCHSVCKAGGDVGPELSAVGSTSPPDYVVRSILNPSAQIKEEFLTRVILTNGGIQYVGIVKDRKNGQVTLRDAAGKTIIIAADDIDTETEGRSLMPEGLTKFLTHQEFLDLASFVSQLGRPGPYAVRIKPVIQRWRVLRNVPAEIASETPNVEMLRIHVLDAKPEDWAPVYAKVSGVLPLADAESLTAGAKGGASAAPKAIYLQGEFDVTEAGPMTVNNTVPAGTTAWIDADPYDGDTARKITLDLPVGHHKLTLRVPIGPNSAGSASDGNGVSVELSKAANSAAQFQPLGGP